MKLLQKLLNQNGTVKTLLIDSGMFAQKNLQICVEIEAFHWA